MRKGYGWIDFIGDDGYERGRKLTYKVREEVLINYFRRRSGRKFVVSKLAEIFGVSDRTIQKHLADLEWNCYIERKACFDENGRQNGNVITYIGPKKRLTGEELTLDKILLIDKFHYCRINGVFFMSGDFSLTISLTMRTKKVGFRYGFLGIFICRKLIYAPRRPWRRHWRRVRWAAGPRGSG